MEVLYVIVITWARGICLITTYNYMPKPKGHRNEGGRNMYQANPD